MHYMNQYRKLRKMKPDNFPIIEIGKLLSPIMNVVKWKSGRFVLMKDILVQIANSIGHVRQHKSCYKWYRVI